MNASNVDRRKLTKPTIFYQPDRTTIELLPVNLADAIIENGKEEIKKINGEIERVQKINEYMAKQIEPLKKAEQAARLEHKKARTLVDPSGAVVIKPEPSYFTTTEASGRIAMEIDGIGAKIRNNNRYISDLESKREDIRKVLESASKGVMTALFRIIGEWSNQNQMRAIMGSRTVVEAASRVSGPTDAAGYDMDLG